MTSTHLSSARSIIGSRPLLSFFVLANTVSWLAWLPYILSGHGLGHWDLRVPGGDLGSQLILLLPGAYLGPITAAVVVTSLADGRAGLRRWARRLVRWRVGWFWYVVTLVGVPAVIIISTIAVGGTPALPPAALLVAFVPGLLIQMVTTGLAEEPGWRDFALPRLQARFGPLRAAAILGPLWAMWHYPLYLTEWGGWPDFSWQRPVEFTVFCIAFNVVMTWVFNRSGQSLPLAMLLHVSVNNFMSVLWSDMFPGLDAELAQPALILAATTAAVLVLVATRGTLGYRPASAPAKDRMPTPA